MKTTTIKKPTYCNGVVGEVDHYLTLDHPHIPKIWNVKQETAQEYPQTEYIEYEMEQMIPITEYISEIQESDEKRRIFREIASAVKYLGKKGIYHQNIKADTIFIHPVTKSAFLTDFEAASNSFILRGCWVDPDISHYYYTNYDNPSRKIMLSGDIWSLGLFGVWLFCDQDIYDSLNEEADDETIDIAYLLYNRFGRGLCNAGLDLESVPKEIIDLIDLLMAPQPYRHQTLELICKL